MWNYGLCSLPRSQWMISVNTSFVFVFFLLLDNLHRGCHWCCCCCARTLYYTIHKPTATIPLINKNKKIIIRIHMHHKHAAFCRHTNPPPSSCGRQIICRHSIKMHAVRLTRIHSVKFYSLARCARRQVLTSHGSLRQVRQPAHCPRQKEAPTKTGERKSWHSQNHWGQRRLYFSHQIYRLGDHCFTNELLHIFPECNLSTTHNAVPVIPRAIAIGALLEVALNELPSFR